MALIIHTVASTYGDSTLTEGGRLRTYVLAQFRSDADLGWVKELRALLVKDELKYVNFRDARPRLRSDQSLWSRIEAGIGQASVIVIDPKPVEAEIRELVRSRIQGNMDSSLEEKIVAETCASVIVSNTPIA